MRWEELSGDQFAEAVKACGGVCLVALSVVERHGHHLPLGRIPTRGAVCSAASQRWSR